MQHMDDAGQRAMASLLRARLAAVGTVLVITHGLRCEELYGAFDAIDTVEKAGDSSRVARADELRLSS